MHLKVIASITNRKITVYNASHGAKSYLCESVNVSPYLPLLELTLHGEDNMSYMPLVDGCLVGRGQRFETEMDFPIFSIAYKGSYRPLFTLVIVFYIS